MNDSAKQDPTDAPDILPQRDELTILKQQADLMGVRYSNNIKVETLRQKIEDHKAGEKQAEEQAAAVAEAASERVSASERRRRRRLRIRRENLRLIRVRIMNLDPKKKDLPGEIITVANKFIGVVRKYVPFGEEATEDGYHIPYVLYKYLKSRRFLNVRVTRVNGKEKISQTWAPEFAIEILPPLTEKERQRLAAAQAAANNE